MSLDADVDGRSSSLIIALPLAGFLVTALVGRRLGLQRVLDPGRRGRPVVARRDGRRRGGAHGGEPFGEAGLGGRRSGTGSRPAPSRSTIGFFVDNLTAVLLIVVTTIGMLVHVYSIGYMRHDPGYWRFFAYLNLFMVSMLLLVLADSWLVLFVAWELVGLSSYLLIGFWYRKRTAAEASKKAFITNRVGDVGFALGIMAIFVNTGTLNIRESIDTLLGDGRRRRRSRSGSSPC